MQFSTQPTNPPAYFPSHKAERWAPLANFHSCDPHFVVAAAWHPAKSPAPTPFRKRRSSTNSVYSESEWYLQLYTIDKYRLHYKLFWRWRSGLEVGLVDDPHCDERQHCLMIGLAGQLVPQPHVRLTAHHRHHRRLFSFLVSQCQPRILRGRLAARRSIFYDVCRLVRGGWEHNHTICQQLINISSQTNIGLRGCLWSCAHAKTRV